MEKKINWVKEQKEGSNAYCLSAKLNGKPVDIIYRGERVFMTYYDGTASHNIDSPNNHFETMQQAEKEILDSVARGYTNRR